MTDLLIKDGTVILPGETLRADVAIADGVVTEVGRLGGLKARRVLDASDQYVMPGMIDPHLHLAHPFCDTRSTDDFWSGTLAAAAGGNTSIIDFAIQWSGTPLDALKARRREADGEAAIDYGLHACLTRSDAEHISCIPQLMEAGIPSFKAYMVYRRQGRKMDDGGLLAMLRETAAAGGMTGVHAENEDMADYNLAVLEREGKLGAEYFPPYKPPIVEAEAVNRVLYLNQWAESQLYIFHLSTGEGLRLVREAKAAGQRVWAETCTHYLTLNEDRYSREDGADFICSPPLRPEEDVEAMWDGVISGDISIISSDHCGFSRQQKREYGSEFTAVPNGLPGVEWRLPVIHTCGVVQERISVNRMVELLSTNPARMFGLYPRKGTLAAGSDGDVILFDPSATAEVGSLNQKTPAGWSPYADFTVRGLPTTVVSRGEIILQDGEVLAQKGRGRFLQRSYCE